MMNFRTISGGTTAEIEEKKSRFIAHLASVANEAEALAVLEAVRIEHRMARHNVYAYIAKEDGAASHQAARRVRYSDDGEPQKTAGLPVLETLQHAGLQDVICVVTRYFGGTLLGTGGLLRAYTQATQKAIEQAEILVISSCVDLRVECPYAYFEQVQHMALAAEAKIIDTDFSDVVRLTLRMLAGHEDKLIHQLINLFHGDDNVTVSEPFEAAF